MRVDEDLTFFNPWEDTRRTQNRLPHWEQPGATYFVTFRLADAIPASLRRQMEAERVIWMKRHPQPWDERDQLEFQKRFLGVVERWLDMGYGSCVLRRPEATEIVAECFRHFDGERYMCHSWVIMPNHVHALFSLHAGQSLKSVLHTWKSFSAHQLCQIASAPKLVWQRDYFDRLVRDERHFWNCVRYIRKNPEKARLRPGAFLLYESEWVSKVVDIM